MMGWGIFFGLWIFGNDLRDGLEAIAKAISERKER